MDLGAHHRWLGVMALPGGGYGMTRFRVIAMQVWILSVEAGSGRLVG